MAPLPSSATSTPPHRSASFQKVANVAGAAQSTVTQVISTARVSRPPGDTQAAVKIRVTGATTAARSSDHDLALGASLARPVVVGSTEAEALGLLVVGEDVGLQPESLEMADSAVRAVVFVALAAVEDVVVVHELHVAGFQVHGDVEPRVSAHRVHPVHGRSRRLRHARRAVVAAARLDVRADVCLLYTSPSPRDG